MARWRAPLEVTAAKGHARAKEEGLSEDAVGDAGQTARYDGEIQALVFDAGVCGISRKTERGLYGVAGRHLGVIRHDHP